MSLKGSGIVIRIGETEWHDIRRVLTLPRQEECQHKRLQYIEHGELLLCLDCEKQVSAVWALKHFFTQYARDKERRDAEREQLRLDAEKLVVHRAALAVQDAWRAHKYLPTCPHCHKAINPPDGFGKSHTSHKQEALPMILRPSLKLVKDATNEEEH